MLKLYFAFVFVLGVASASVPMRTSRCSTEQSGPTPVPPYRTVEYENYYMKPLVPVVELQYTPPLSCHRGVLVVTACDVVAPNVLFRSPNDVVVVRKGSLLQTAVVKAKYLCPYYGNKGKGNPVNSQVENVQYEDSQYQDVTQEDYYEELPYQDNQGTSYAVPSNVGSSYAVPSKVGSSYSGYPK